MKLLNYVAYSLSSIFIPQPIVTYGVGKGIFTDNNIWWVVGIAGLSSGVIFLIFALIDINLRRINFERGLKRHNARKNKKENQ